MFGKQLKGKGRKRLLTISLFATVGVLATVLVVWAGTGLTRKIISERQAELIEELKSNFADSPAFLVERLFDMQNDSINLFVPGMPNPVCFSAGMFSFDPKAFPESFLKGLVYEPEHGSPVYHLKLREVRATREIEVLDADGKVFYVFKPRSDYDPLWLAKRKHPEIFKADFESQRRVFVEECMEPSHVEMTIDLIPEDYVEVYAEETVSSLLDVLLATDTEKTTSSTVTTLSKSSSTSLLSGGMTMMMRMAGSDTNIVFSKIGPVSSGMLFRVDYPDTLTNRLEVIVSTNLLDRHRWVVETNLVTAGTNSLLWVDLSATNLAGTPDKFYWIGSSVDNDGDGVEDGREVIIYHTNPNSLDSDNDGLVDGYSGVVSTNAYPGGVTTNGSPYVEGELSWGTDPSKFDTDGDGMGDGWEVAHGHNPLDPNDPPNVSGTVLYSGHQTGTLWVVAVTDSNSWSTAHCYTSTVSSFPQTYLIPDLEQTNYWIKSWLDSNGDGQTNATEALGTYTNVSSIITNCVIGQDITLVDPDSDNDGLPDWWEIHWFGSTTNYDGSADPDGDLYTNQEEYEAGTDPTDISSHPWNISGTITYAGPQTGTIHVVACTNETDWGWVYSVTLTNVGSYTITHLPPNTDYWIRAWMDSNGDALPTSWEAWGSHNSNPVFLDSNLTGQDISMLDPDQDGDGLPDWWEVLYGLDPTGGGEDGAVAWWKMDEGSGTNVLDETANANNGVLKNGTNAWVSGIISNALSFNGTNAYVEVPDSVSLKPDAVSVGMWITPSRIYTNGTAMFLSKRVPNGSAGYSLGYENGKVVFTFCSSGAKSLGYSCALTSGVPVHVAGSFGGTLQSLFINGSQVVSTNYDWGSGFGTVDQDTNVLRLGSASGATPTNFFAGMLDDVRVFPGGWTTNEVKAVWELGADPDGDGLSNTEEYKHGTNPTNSDTDGDGLTDGSEVYLFGTDPTHVVNATLPFETGFEATNGFVSGALNNQQGWITFPVGDMSVQSYMPHSGAQAVSGQGLSSLSSHGLASTAAVVTAEAWIYWNATQSVPPTNLPSGTTTLVSFDAAQGVVAFNGDGYGSGSWITASNTLLVSQWVDLKVEQNYTNRTWRLWVNGVEKLSGLGFKDNTPARLRAVNMQDGTAGPLFMDDLKVGAQ